MGCGGIIVSYCIFGMLILGCILGSIMELVMLFSNGLQMVPLLGSLISLVGISVWMTKDKIQKENFDIYGESVKLILIFGTIQFFFWTLIEFDSSDRLLWIFYVVSFGEVAKCYIGNLVSSSFENSRKERLKEYRKQLYDYYHKQADILREAVRNIDELKKVSNATENLVKLLLRCGCTVLRTSFQDLDLSRNIAFVNSLKDNFKKAELDIISDSMSIAEIREEAEKQILKKQKKYNYYHTEYYNETDYKKIKDEYDQVIRKRKPLTHKTIKFTMLVLVTIVVLVAMYDVHRKNSIYEEALSYQKSGEYIQANDLFESIRGYKDVNALMEKQKFEVEHQRIERAKIGDVVTLGECNDDTLEVNGPIEWIVLCRENGEALLISKEILTHKAYNETPGKTTWETSTLRKWLNTTFCQNVFDKKEYKWIWKHTVRNNTNRYYGVSAGRNTEDKVFLLSSFEAEKRWPSEISSDWWWLRTPGERENYAARVSITGDIQQRGVIVTENGGVRPAMWVS